MVNNLFRKLGRVEIFCHETIIKVMVDHGEENALGKQFPVDFVFNDSFDVWNTRNSKIVGATGNICTEKCFALLQNLYDVY